MRNPAFNKLLEEMRELHEKKNHDYANESNPYSNFDFAATVSSVFELHIDRVFATIIGIKMARIGELTRRQDSSGGCKVPNNEPLDDTYRDLAVYAALWASSRITR